MAPWRVASLGPWPKVRWNDLLRQRIVQPSERGIRRDLLSEFALRVHQILDSAKTHLQCVAHAARSVHVVVRRIGTLGCSYTCLRAAFLVRPLSGKSNRKPNADRS